MNIRLLTYFSGRVQGVGFRYTTQRLASSFDVTGTVRNLPDGRVEVVAEGLPGEVRSFVDAIQEAMEGNIQATDVHTLDATGEFVGFRIRHD